jgi:hypothetical protein
MYFVDCSYSPQLCDNSETNLLVTFGMKYPLRKESLFGLRAAIGFIDDHLNTSSVVASTYGILNWERSEMHEI